MKITMFIKLVALVACLQLAACGKSSSSSGGGSASPATNSAPAPADDKETQTPDQFEPGGETVPPAAQGGGQQNPQPGQQPQQPGAVIPPAQQQPAPSVPNTPPPAPQGGGAHAGPTNPGQHQLPQNPNFQPAPQGQQGGLPPGPIQGGIVPDVQDGGLPSQPVQPPQQNFSGDQLTGLAYNQNYNYAGSGRDSLLSDLKNRYASLPGNQFAKSRERASSISKIRIGFNAVSNQVYAMVSLRNGNSQPRVHEFRGSPNTGMQSLQSGPRLSLNCQDSNCFVMVGRLDFNDGTHTSFIYRNLDKRLIFDFLTSGAVTEQTYRNWMRLIDSQLEIDPNCAKIVYREYATYEVAFGRADAVLVIKTNFNELVEIAVPMVLPNFGNAGQMGLRGELQGLSGTPYLSHNIRKTEIVQNSGSGNLVIKVTTGRSAVDQGEFLISVVEK